MESRSLLRLVQYHWAIIAACIVFGLLAGQAMAVVAPREYTASADVFVTVTGGSSTGEIAQSANFSQQQARNFSAIATREVVLEPVIESLDLDHTVPQLRRQVSTSVALNTSIITISATDPSPDRAAAIADSVAKNLAEIVPTLTPRVDGESPVRLQVIESAIAPRNPSSPNTPLLLVVGLLIGLICAAVLVVFRGILDARIRSKDQVTEITGAPVLGQVMHDRRMSRHPVAVAADSRSNRAEQYRQLRANLRFLQPGEQHKVFVITSASPGEGKSSTAANVAASLAASGLSVCLVEADLRKPTLSSILDLPHSPGMTAVLTEESTIDDALVPWGTDGLKVLPAGDLPPNPSELLESAIAADMFQTVRTRFDVTIVDCPPLNPVSDAAVIARLLGGVVLVVAAGSTRVRDLRRAIDRLAAIGAGIDGAVLSMVRARGGNRVAYGYSAAEREKHALSAPAAGAIATDRIDAERPEDAPGGDGLVETIAADDEALAPAAADTDEDGTELDDAAHADAEDDESEPAEEDEAADDEPAPGMPTKGSRTR